MKKPLIGMLALAIALMVLQSCATKLQILSPAPRINIEPQKKTLALEFGPDIKDRFTIPATGFDNEVIASNWLQSLKNGFNKGFSPFFKIVDTEPELTIRLLKTEVYYERTGEETMPAIISVSSTPQSTMTTPSSISTFTCKILYQAQLVSAKGESLEKAFGTSTSTIFSADISLLTTSSVENMYEQIAQKFFSVK